MKKLNIITALLTMLIVLMGCKKECTFVYSEWTSCSNNMQTRTYTSSPSGCTGTPPADSTQRSCVMGKIGNKIWATKNLDVSTYRNGDAIPQVQNQNDWSKLTTGAWCYYENNTAIGTKCGKLYNWYAVNDSRGLAPTGYHIPSDGEWTILTDYLGYEAGTKMKSTTDWKQSLVLNFPPGGTNTSGFEALPGGYRSFYGFEEGIHSQVWGVGNTGCWWSSTAEFKSYSAYGRLLHYQFEYVDIVTYEKPNGLSVRCIKD